MYGGRMKYEKVNFVDIKDKYLNVFMANLTQQDMKEIYMEQFIWHAFSYEKVHCLEGADAIKEFKKQGKNEVYLFFQDNDDVIKMKNLTYENLIKMVWNNEIPSDCYVVDVDFEWTFVYTHETASEEEAKGKRYYIGPFFKSIDINYYK